MNAHSPKPLLGWLWCSFEMKTENQGQSKKLTKILINDNFCHNVVVGGLEQKPKSLIIMFDSGNLKTSRYVQWNVDSAIGIFRSGNSQKQIFLFDLKSPDLIDMLAVETAGKGFFSINLPPFFAGVYSCSFSFFFPDRIAFALKLPCDAAKVYHFFDCS